MNSKYYNAMSKIKASDELKEKIKADLNSNTIKEKSFVYTIRKWFISIIAILSSLVCSGFAYAALGGTINGVPVIEWLGIKFSNNYTQYEQVVEDQYIENEYAKLQLQSTVCDDGFTIFKFNLKIKDIDSINKKIFYGDWTQEQINKIQLQYVLLLNEEGEKDYNKILIIDGQKQEVSSSVQSIQEISKNKEYTIYQMWFLTDDILNKDTFTVTLEDIVLSVNGQSFKFDRSFNVELSKSEAKQNTKKIATNNQSISYSYMDKKIESIKVTPLQNIIKFSSKLNMLDASDEFGTIRYIVTDQNGNELDAYNIINSEERILKDGTVKKVNIYNNSVDLTKDLSIAQVNYTEYLAIEQNESILELNIDVYITYPNARKIGTFKIDLKNNKVSSENKNEETEQNNKTHSNSQVSIPTYASTNTNWESYPNNIDQKVKEIVNSFYSTENLNYFGKGLKTIFSLVNNNLLDDKYDSIYRNILYGYTDFAGDDFTDIRVETNYEQYDYLSKNNNLQKYSDLINYKIAMFHLMDSDIYTNNGITQDLSSMAQKHYEKLLAQNYNSALNYYYKIDKVVIMNGNNTSKQDFENNARAKKVKITINNNKEFIVDLEDTNKAQVFDINYTQNDVSKPVNITIEVLEAYSGNTSQDLYISDIQFGISTNISMGI